MPSRPTLPATSAALLLCLGLAAPAIAQSPSSDLAARRAAHIEVARERTLAACKEKGLALPPAFLAWVDGDPLVRASVYGCRKDPLPVLLALRSLEIDLGETVVRREATQLALAFAIQRSYQKKREKAAPWNDGDIEPPDAELPDVTPRPPLVLSIPGDPRVPVDTKDSARTLDRDDHIVNFLEDHAEIEVEAKVEELPPLVYDEKGIAKPRGKAVTVVKQVKRKPLAADVIADPVLQREFNAYMASHGHPEVSIDCGERVVHWTSEAAVDDEALRNRIASAHELFQAAYRSKGRAPAARDRAPSMAESMAWFLRNHRYGFAPEMQKERGWPRLPLETPWPLLVMLAEDDQPLREREEIWARFRDRGELRTYGEYIGGIAQQFDMQSARRVSPFAFSYGSIQMMWKDGGVCGTMGNIGARTWRILGVPASTAGQPGHCALVKLERSAEGQFRYVGEQYATGGDEVTHVHARWYCDDEGGRRPMVFHQAVAFACNHSFASTVDTLVLRRVYDALPEAQQREEAPLFVAAALEVNPFALVVLERVIAEANSVEALLSVQAIFERTAEPKLDAKEHALYRTTVRDLVHARIGALPAPQGKQANASLLQALDRQGCTDAKLLARCWRAVDGEEGFVTRCEAALQEYLRSPERTKNGRAGRELAGRLQKLGQTVKGEKAKAAWAGEMLEHFAGKETLVLRGKPALDPVVVTLCKIAGRELPKVGTGQ
ncbi:MAG: hypothetical protein IPN34_15100 [Planctomycetes bacterium]|nr:hypothetical protein [Planctomycetota bacterium]